ncbi:MAG: LacI family DNA-binding transcriptional regulator [Eudoraea sp.]|uniref:LacI family DNA-binding transcriptional regulator n=1 Tax=Eudoraea sp. TaxID=1979955 RepID=UPI00326565CF
MPTLKQIAKDLSISVSTVSRILNGKGKEWRISDATMASVLKYVEEVGYSPNLIAKGLQASQTFTIGLMVPDIANPFFATMAKNIEKWASRAHNSIILIDSDKDVEKEKIQVLNMMGRKVDGLRFTFFISFSLLTGFR